MMITVGTFGNTLIFRVIGPFDESIPQPGTLPTSCRYQPVQTPVHSPVRPQSSGLATRMTRAWLARRQSSGSMGALVGRWLGGTLGGVLYSILQQKTPYRWVIEHRSDGEKTTIILELSEGTHLIIDEQIVEVWCIVYCE